MVAGAIYLAAVPATADSLRWTTFADRWMTAHADQDRFPAAVLTVVSRQETLALSTHGHWGADNQPVSERTPFHVASLSKVVTADIARRLLKAELMSLEDEVSVILRKDVPGHPPAEALAQALEGVQVRHLITHTAGFSDKYLGLSRPEGAAQAPLDEWLTDTLPEQVYPVGTTYLYTNHATTILGDVLVRVASIDQGYDFHDVARRLVFEPTGMTRSSFESLGKLWAEESTEGARPHERIDDAWQAADMDTILTVPASALTSSAEDMARFLQSQLDLEFDPGMKPNTVPTPGSPCAPVDLKLEGLDLPWRPLFRLMPDAGIALGSHVVIRHGVHIYFHHGSWRGASALLMIVPEADRGLFFAMNAIDEALTGKLFEEAIESLLAEHLEEIPEETRAEAFSADQFQRLQEADLLGRYIPVRHAYDDFTAMDLLFSSLTVEPMGNRLSVRDAQDDQTFGPPEKTPLVSLLNGTWCYEMAATGSSKAMFEIRQDGTQFLHFSAWADTQTPASFVKPTPLMNPFLHLLFLVAFMTLFFAAGLVWPLAAWLGKSSETSAANRWTQRGVMLAAILLFFSLLFLVLGSLTTAPYDYMYGTPGLVSLGAWLRWPGLILGLLSILAVVLAFREKLKWRVRLLSLGLAIVFVLHWPFVAVWNLI